jgi:hypothetical protein
MALRLFIVLMVAFVEAQLTPKIKSNMVGIATDEITKQLVNGSDSHSQTDMTKKSLLRIVQSG